MNETDRYHIQESDDSLMTFLTSTKSVYAVVCVAVTVGTLATSAKDKHTTDVRRANMVQKEFARTFDLEDYEWKKRLLLIFAPAANHPSFKIQRKRMKDKSPETAERDLMVVDVFETGESHAEGVALDEKTSASLRDRFKIEAGQFVVLLIGKDGTEKFRGREPVAPTDIFSLIDSMPMRREEMNKLRDRQRNPDAP